MKTSNQNDVVKSVHIKDRDGNVKSILWYDPEAKQVKLDPMNLGDLTLRDFTRIHSFFRRVQAMKLNGIQQDQERRLPLRSITRSEEDNYSGVTAQHFQRED
jgi:hypothetical protein